MKKQSTKYILYTKLTIGFVVLLMGVLFDIFAPSVNSLKYVAIGIGAGLIGAVIPKVSRMHMLKNNPEMAKQYEINEHDERNIQLRQKSAYVAWYITLFTLSVSALIFVVLDIKIACWISIAALFIHMISFFVFLTIYDKKF